MAPVTYFLAMEAYIVKQYTARVSMSVLHLLQFLQQVSMTCKAIQTVPLLSAFLCVPLTKVLFQGPIAVAASQKSLQILVHLHQTGYKRCKACVDVSVLIASKCDCPQLTADHLWWVPVLPCLSLIVTSIS